MTVYGIYKCYNKFLFISFHKTRTKLIINEVSSFDFFNGRVAILEIMRQFWFCLLLLPDVTLIVFAGEYLLISFTTTLTSVLAEVYKFNIVFVNILRINFTLSADRNVQFRLRQIHITIK